MSTQLKLLPTKIIKLKFGPWGPTACRGVGVELAREEKFQKGQKCTKDHFCTIDIYARVKIKTFYFVFNFCLI